MARYEYCFYRSQVHLNCYFCQLSYEYLYLDILQLASTHYSYTPIVFALSPSPFSLCLVFGLPPSPINGILVNDIYGRSLSYFSHCFMQSIKFPLFNENFVFEFGKLPYNVFLNSVSCRIMCF